MQQPLSQELSINLGRSKVYSNSNDQNSLFYSKVDPFSNLNDVSSPCRYKPVEALKTALEGSPPNTRDERCKVCIFLLRKFVKKKSLIFFFFGIIGVRSFSGIFFPMFSL